MRTYLMDKLKEAALSSERRPLGRCCLFIQSEDFAVNREKRGDSERFLGCGRLNVMGLPKEDRLLYVSCGIRQLDRNPRRDASSQVHVRRPVEYHRITPLPD